MNFAVNMYMLGKFYEIEPSLINGVRRIESGRMPRKTQFQDYIKVENASKGLELNLIIRGNTCSNEKEKHLHQEM